MLGPECSLQNRILFHIAHKMNDENKLMGHHQKLEDTIEDQVLLLDFFYLDIYPNAYSKHNMLIGKGIQKETKPSPPLVVFIFNSLSSKPLPGSHRHL